MRTSKVEELKLAEVDCNIDGEWSMASVESLYDEMECGSI